MLRWITLIAVAATACLAVGSSGRAGAGAPLPRFGVADDAGKYADDGGRGFFRQISDVGLKTNRMMVVWSPSSPLQIPERSFLDAAIPQANAVGVRIVLAVRPARADAIGSSAVQARQFASFLTLLARTYRSVKTFEVGNEPNQPRFWRPQYRGSRAVAGADYERMLALSYDALKSVDPAITVIGGVLSSRGNDNPAAPTNQSRSPIRFIRDLGAAYRVSRRSRPIMDSFGFHPYPRSNRDAISRGLEWPQAGFVDLGRVKQGLWDAFHGTTQPTIENGLSIAIDEIGWQVRVSDSASSVYTGSENVPVTDEATQAQIYVDLIRRASCDASISDLFLLPFIDEVGLAGFQSGLIRADGSKRPSYEAVKATLERRQTCSGRRIAWHHSERVFGARALFGSLQKPRWWRQTSWSFGIRAGEEIRYRARIVRSGRRVASAGAPRAVLQTHGIAMANWTPRVRFPARRLAPGRYAYVAEIRAAMNPLRLQTFTSKPFVVR